MCGIEQINELCTLSKIEIYNCRIMKRLVPILLMLIVNSVIAQNIWEPINFPDTLKSRAINTEKEGILFVATGGNNEFGGLFRSFDLGNAWMLLDLNLPSYIPLHTIKYTSNGNLLIGTSFCILRSEDDGDSFEQACTTGGNILKFNISPTNDIYAVGWGTILRSSNDGITWDTVLFTYSNIYFADIDFGINGEIYTVGGSYDGPHTGSGFHRSLDNGVSWENIGITDQHLNSIEVNNDGVILVGSNSAAIYSSNDGGVSWSLVSSMVTTVIESTYQDNLIAGVNGYNYNGCRFSEDWGNTWVSLNDTVLNPYINQISISPDNTVYLQCINLSSQQYQLFRSYDPILRIKDVIPTPEILLYPNPTNNKLSILSYPRVEISRYAIYNQNGQKIVTGKLINNSINVSTLKHGLYIIEFEIESKIVRKKVIIE